MNKFLNDIPEEELEQFKAIISEGQFVARTVLHASIDVADMAT